jgi:hypothetical protein
VQEGHGLRKATACTAADDHGKSDAGLPLAEFWDGRKWTLEPTSKPRDKYGSLSGVSCTSASACMAVGSSTNMLMSIFDVALAEFSCRRGLRSKRMVSCHIDAGTPCQS